MNILDFSHYYINDAIAVESGKGICLVVFIEACFIRLYGICSHLVAS
jgi:hypothetical protein